MYCFPGLYSCLDCEVSFSWLGVSLVYSALGCFDVVACCLWFDCDLVCGCVSCFHFGRLVVVFGRDLWFAYLVFVVVFGWVCCFGAVLGCGLWI